MLVAECLYEWLIKAMVAINPEWKKDFRQTFLSLDHADHWFMDLGVNVS
jgi:hypothetical protein